LLCHRFAVRSLSSTTTIFSVLLNLGLIPSHRLSRFSSISQVFFFALLLRLTRVAQQSSTRTFRLPSHLQFMPRRPPPTPLLLYSGPLPPRGQSKFTMPSVPRPIFCPVMVHARRLVPRERVYTIRAGGELGGRVEGCQESGPSRAVGGGHIRSIATPPNAVVGTGCVKGV